MNRTEVEALDTWCPLRGNGLCCQGVGCMMWRWQPLMADDAFKEAVKKAALDIGDKHPSRPKAAAHVVANRAEYGLPDKPYKGYCGIAGKPE